MSYYRFSKGKVLHKAKENHSKEKAPEYYLTLFRMGFFRAAHGWGRGGGEGRQIGHPA